MERAFLDVFNNSVAVSWLVLAVLLARLLLRKAPKSARCALWTLVGLRLCLPVRFRSVFSLVPSAYTLNPGIALAARPRIDSGLPAVDRLINPAVARSFTPEPWASANPLQIWLYIAAWVWLTGLGLLLLYAAVSYLRLYLRMAPSLPLRDNIRLSERAETPFLMGFVRPRIYLPLGLDEEDRELAVTHEWAHVERRDHVLRPLAFLLVSVYWFNPLLWLSFALLCRDIELACDERVLKKLGPEQKKAYSRALLACSTSRRGALACPVAFGEKGVEGRIKSILTYRKPPVWLSLLAAALCVLLALCFLTDPPGLRLDTAADPVVAAQARDLRLDTDQPREYRQAELDELNSRLAHLSSSTESGIFEGSTRLFSIDAEMESGESLRISGYRAGGDILYKNRRYAIEDGEFLTYLARFCQREDTSPAIEAG